MPRDLFVIGIGKDGSTSLLIGREIDNAKTRAKFHEWRSGGAMPKGIAEAHLYDSEEGRVGIAFDEVTRRTEVHAAAIKEIEAAIVENGACLKRAREKLEELGKAKKSTPEVGHTQRAIQGYEEAITALKSKLEEARTAADDHAKSAKANKG